MVEHMQSAESIHADYQESIHADYQAVSDPAEWSYLTAVMFPFLLFSAH